MNKQEFDKLYVGNNIAIHCPTEELANEFLKLADSFGYKTWNGGRVCIVEDNNWHIYKENTVYYVKFGGHGFVYGHADSAKLHSEPIIEYKPQPKSLFEQALELIGLKIGDEFTFNFINSFGRRTNIYKFEEDGSLWHMVNSNLWELSQRSLVDILTSGKLPKLYKPKSEADIALEELNKAIKKATDVLKGSGYNV